VGSASGPDADPTAGGSAAVGEAAGSSSDGPTGDLTSQETTPTPT